MFSVANVLAACYRHVSVSFRSLLFHTSAAAGSHSLGYWENCIRVLEVIAHGSGFRVVSDE